MAEELNQKQIETHKHIMLAFKMDSATNIGLVNIFYSIIDFVFNDNHGNQLYQYFNTRNKYTKY